MIPAVLGLPDALAGVVLGWLLATVTGLAGAAARELGRRRDAALGRRTAARLIREELRVAQRAVLGDDPHLLAGGRPLPTDVWNRRREQLVDAEHWDVIASAFAAIDDFNGRRQAALTWRTDETARELQEVRERIPEALAAADDALARLSA